MKQTYIKPEMNVEEILVATMLAASTATMSITNDYVEEAASNDRRGGWGNLWD
ncbi:MAG: hypothetical protein IIX50_05675 [Bacteroidaceae bacterium]|nr:hypothetical protein [Bacteroidaceae bacterium]